MTQKIRCTVLSALALAGAAAISGCGAGASADTGSSAATRHAAAEQLIAQVQDVNPKASSGRFDATLDLNIEHSSLYDGATQLTASGVWNLPDGAEVPDVELDVGLARDDHALGGTLVVKDGAGYIKLGSIGYKLPAAISRVLVAPARGARNGLTKTAAMFRINPQNWQRNAELAGDGSVAGEPVQKITGEIRPDVAFLDLAKITHFLTLIGVTQALGLPAELGPKLRAALVRSVTVAKGEVYIAKDDDVLRKAHLHGEAVVAPRDRKLLFGATGGTVDATVSISEVGTPHEVAAPAQLEPYSSLQLSLSALAEAVRRDATH